MSLCSSSNVSWSDFQTRSCSDWKVLTRSDSPGLPSVFSLLSSGPPPEEDGKLLFRVLFLVAAPPRLSAWTLFNWGLRLLYLSLSVSGSSEAPDQQQQLWSRLEWKFLLPQEFPSSLLPAEPPGWPRAGETETSPSSPPSPPCSSQANLWSLCWLK